MTELRAVRFVRLLGSAARRENAEEDKQTHQAGYDNQGAVKEEFSDEAEPALRFFVSRALAGLSAITKALSVGMRLQV